MCSTYDVYLHHTVYSTKRLLSSAFVFETTCPPPSIQNPTCLPVSLPLSVKEKSIFRQNREEAFFLLLSSPSISGHILWREKGLA